MSLKKTFSFSRKKIELLLFQRLVRYLSKIVHQLHNCADNFSSFLRKVSYPSVKYQKVGEKLRYSILSHDETRPFPPAPLLTTTSWSYDVDDDEDVTRRVANNLGGYN